MGRITDTIRNILQGKRRREFFDAEELRITFKARYHQFRLLLNANHNALDVMAEIEEALKGFTPFGMHFVRACCTRVSTSVWQIIRHLNQLAPGRYEALHERFREIQKKINPFAYPPKILLKEVPLVLPIMEVDKTLADQVGSKMANLGEIKSRMRIAVPNGFVITTHAYQRFMTHNQLKPEIDRRIQATDVVRLDQLYGLSSAIQQRIIGSNLPEELKEAISEHYRILEREEGPGIRVAVRSSALGEDLAGTSFAGQYRSELNVSGEHIFEAYKEIIASKYGISAMAYRLNRGIRDEDVAMCVGVLPMVDAVSGGVAYSRNPVNLNDDSVIINSVWGLPKPVVDGSMTSDLFILSRGDPMVIQRKEIVIKERKFICYADEGVCRLDITEGVSEKPSLSDEDALEIARLVIRLEAYYGVPQDMEWAIRSDGSIVVLQCRPLQQMGVPQEGGRVGEIEEMQPVIVRGGVTASPGAASGLVFVLKRDADALKFPREAVLVAAQALPRWASLMDSAAAVITEKGSMAGHLANVAREFHVPALFGVKGAMDLLKDGMVITVDADARRIYDGRIDDLLERRERSKTLMEGTPVFEALKGAAQYIIPLHLLNADAPSFNPKNCKTFHDITRFCHEKAVQEMFKFGKEHHFSERSSKQLVCDVPMQWWVLNLDDGFKEEVEGKYVHLDNIVSIPMLALWKGITAFPWEGPPPVDGKGFMSVMFQATTNRALTVGVPSKFANRNYFMISKNYCSLHSRLGFHFSTVETILSDRSRENYVSFQFKGGAADLERRLLRLLFIKDILEEFGFTIELREDHLLARIEDHERDIMEERLKILGYLNIHTRQLDMIMANPRKVNYYRSKIDREIEELIRTPVSETHR